jgi:iron complex transport system ATP-binding protein
MIEIENLSFSYEKNKKVLDNINLTIDSGEFVGIVGPNGCGKSTLINLLCRVLEYRTGQIQINNRDIKTIAQHDLAKHIAVVPQESSFEFDFTVNEIVLMGRLPHLSRFQMEGDNDHRIAKTAMTKTKCWKYRDKLIRNLSGGEKQRVIVARALTQEPSILLLDEPTSHLDMNFQYEILDLIARLNRTKKVTILGVFHDINLASKYSDRLMIMKQGKIIADGPPRQVINTNTLAQIYDFQIILKKHPKEGYKYILPDMVTDVSGGSKVDKKLKEKADLGIELNNTNNNRNKLNGEE